MGNHPLIYIQEKTYHQFVVLYDIALQKLTMQFVGHQILALSRGAAEPDSETLLQAKTP